MNVATFNGRRLDWRGLLALILVPLLVAGGIAVGYLLGNALADLGCRTFGWYAGAPPVDRAVELRNSILITVLAGIVGSYYFYTASKSAMVLSCPCSLAFRPVLIPQRQHRKQNKGNQHTNTERDGPIAAIRLGLLQPTQK